MVVEFDSSKRDMSASEFYNMFYETFSTGRYKDMLEKYRNNVRLDYNSNYHFDIMPSVPLRNNSLALSVPDAKRRDWVIRSPKTFIEWFNNQTKKIQGYKVKTFDNRRIIMESEVTPLKKPAPYEMTPTLIRTVQLLKRIKDVFFRDYKGEKKPVPMTMKDNMPINTQIIGFALSIIPDAISGASKELITIIVL